MNTTTLAILGLWIWQIILMILLWNYHDDLSKLLKEMCEAIDVLNEGRRNKRNAE